MKPGRIGNMSLHSRHIHDGIITAVQNEAEIFALSPLIQQIRGEKTQEGTSSTGLSPAQTVAKGLKKGRASLFYLCELINSA